MVRVWYWRRRREQLEDKQSLGFLHLENTRALGHSLPRRHDGVKYLWADE